VRHGSFVRREYNTDDVVSMCNYIPLSLFTDVLKLVTLKACVYHFIMMSVFLDITD
jgi:hypothetical protein